MPPFFPLSLSFFRFSFLFGVWGGGCSHIPFVLWKRARACGRLLILSELTRLTDVFCMWRLARASVTGGGGGGGGAIRVMTTAIFSGSAVSSRQNGRPAAVTSAPHSPHHPPKKGQRASVSSASLVPHIPKQA